MDTISTCQSWTGVALQGLLDDVFTHLARKMLNILFWHRLYNLASLQLVVEMLLVWICIFRKRRLKLVWVVSVSKVEKQLLGFIFLLIVLLCLLLLDNLLFFLLLHVCIVLEATLLLFHLKNQISFWLIFNYFIRKILELLLNHVKYINL